MAIEIRINPLDFEPDIAIGIDLPMMSSVGAGFQQTYFSLDQAVANAKNLLYTNRGERIMQPLFGCNLRAVLFENITEDMLLTIESTIKDSFKYWLPYIFINELSVEGDPDRNRILVTMSISLNGNTFDTRSIQVIVTNNQA